MIEQCFEISIFPYAPFPDSLLREVFGGTGLEPRKEDSCDCGNYLWEYPDVSPEQWEEIRKNLANNITALHMKKAIRGGQW